MACVKSMLVKDRMWLSFGIHARRCYIWEIIICKVSGAWDVQVLYGILFD